MNILYFADPRSVHDLKWITFFSKRPGYKTYLLPLNYHCEDFSGHQRKILADDNINILSPIRRFSIVRFFRTIIDAYRILRVVRIERIDLIHILYADPNALWAVFSNLFGVPIGVTTRGTDILVTIPNAFKKKDQLNFLVARLYRLAFRKVTWLTSTSTSQIRSLKDLGLWKDQVHLVRTGLDLSTIQRNELPSGLKDREYILFPRTMRPVCNHEFCIEALSLCPDRIKSRYTMVFVDRNGYDRAYVQKIERLLCKLKDVNVLFLNSFSNLSMMTLYRQASLVVMTPLSDGSPVSAMETMLCESPLILGNVEYDNDLFADVTRLQSWEPQELCNLMVSVLESDQTSNLSTLAARIIELCDRSKEMLKIETLYQSTRKLA